MWKRPLGRRTAILSLTVLVLSLPAPGIAAVPASTGTPVPDDSLAPRPLPLPLPSGDTTNIYGIPRPCAAAAGANRLFFMSTGETMPAGNLSAGVHELLGVHAAYSPLSFLQFNASYVIDDSYLSVGTKVQVLPASGLFRGLSIGYDLGYSPAGTIQQPHRPIHALTVSASYGEIPRVHVALVATTDGYNTMSRPPTFLQIGMTTPATLKADGSGFMFMSEFWMSRNRAEQSDLGLGGIMGGVRWVKGHFAGEVALIFPEIYFDYVRYIFTLVPYVSATYYL